MKLYLDWDEMYPVYTVSEELGGYHGVEVEVDRDEFLEAMEVERKFYAWQEKLDTLCDQAKKNGSHRP